MTELAIRLLAFAVLPFAAGLAVPARIAARWNRPHPAALVLAVLAAGAWLAAAHFCRAYADTDRWGWRATEGFAHSGKWHLFAAAAMPLLGVAVRQALLRNDRRRLIAAAATAGLVAGLVAWRTLPVYGSWSASRERFARILFGKALLFAVQDSGPPPSQPVEKP